MGGVGSSTAGTQVTDREWLRLGSELNLVESALYSRLGFNAAALGPLCKYCKDPNHTAAECTIAIRAGLETFDDDESEAQPGDAQPVTSLLQANKLEGLVEPRPRDRTVTAQLLTERLFAFSLQSSSFTQIATLRHKLVSRLRQAVDRLNLQSPDCGTGAGADAADDGPSAALTAASKVNQAVFSSLVASAAGREHALSPAGAALRKDIVSRVLSLVQELPSLSLFAPDGTVDTAWLAGLEDWLNLVASPSAGEDVGADDARTALLHLAMCTGSLQAVLQTVLAVLEGGASISAAAMARVMRYRSALPINSALLHDDTSRSSALLGAWCVDSIPGEDKLKAASKDDADDAPAVGAGGHQASAQAALFQMLGSGGPMPTLRTPMTAAIPMRAAVPMRAAMPSGGVRGASGGGTKDEASSHGFSALAADGRFLYIHSPLGLRKVGTGYNGTARGRTYAWRPRFHPEGKCWLAAVAGRLFVRSSFMKTSLQVLDCGNLETVESINDPELGLSTVSAPSPLFTCGYLLYVVREREHAPDATPEFDVVKYSPLSKSVVARVPLSGPAPGPIHKTSCFGCHRVGFTGVAYKCSECKEYLLCKECHVRKQQELAASGVVPVRPKNGNRNSSTHADWHAMVNVTASVPAEDTLQLAKRGPYVHNKAPAPRAGQAAAAIGTTVYVHGGCAAGYNLGNNAVQVVALFNDFYAFDTMTLQWRTVRKGKRVVGEAGDDDDGEETKGAVEEQDSKDDGDAEGELPKSADAEGDAEELPKGVVGHSMTHVPAASGEGQGSLFLFGGADDLVGKGANNDLFRYDVAADKFTSVIAHNRPNPRAQHAAVLIPETPLTSKGRQLLVFGGLAEEEKADGATGTPAAPNGQQQATYLADMWVLPVDDVRPAADGEEPEPVKWKQLELDGEVPALAGAGILPLEGPAGLQLLVAGGWMDKGTKLNSDIYLLDLTENPVQVTKLDTKGTAVSPTISQLMVAPGSPLSESGLASVVDGKVLAHCGGSSYTQNPFAVLDMATKRWTPITGGHDPGHSRNFHSLTRVDDTLVMLGGVLDGICVMDETFVETRMEHNTALTRRSLQEGLFYANAHEMAVLLPPSLPPNSVIQHVAVSRVFALAEDEKPGRHVRDTNCGFEDRYTSTVQPSTAPLTCAGSVCYDAVNNMVWHADSVSGMVMRWCNSAPSATSDEALTASLATDGAEGAFQSSSDVFRRVQPLVEQMLSTADGSSAAGLEPAQCVAVLLAAVDRLAAPHIAGSEQVHTGDTTSLHVPFAVDASRRTLALALTLLQRLRSDDADAAGVLSTPGLRKYAVGVALRVVRVNLQRIVSAHVSLRDVGLDGEEGAACLAGLRVELQAVVDGAEDNIESASDALAALAVGSPLFFPRLADRRDWAQSQLKALLSAVGEDSNENSVASKLLAVFAPALAQQRHVSMLVAPPHVSEAPALAELLPLEVAAVGGSLTADSAKAALDAGGAPMSVRTTEPVDLVVRQRGTSDGQEFVVTQLNVRAPSLAQHASPLAMGVMLVWNCKRGTGEPTTPALNSVTALDDVTPGRWLDVRARYNKRRHHKTKPIKGKVPRDETVLSALIGPDAGNELPEDAPPSALSMGLVCATAFHVKPGEEVRVSLPSPVVATHVQFKFIKGAVAGGFGVRGVAVFGAGVSKLPDFIRATTAPDLSAKRAATLVPAASAGAGAAQDAPVVSSDDMSSQVLDGLKTASMAWLAANDRCRAGAD